MATLLEEILTFSEGPYTGTDAPTTDTNLVDLWEITVNAGDVETPSTPSTWPPLSKFTLID